jgi:WD40 repeat protein
MRLLLTLFLTAAVSFAATVVKPEHSIDVEGNVVDMVVRGDTLYAATDAGKLEVYDWKSRKLLYELEFETIHDFLGDPMKPKVFCVDVNAKGDTLAVMVQDEEGERILYLYHPADKKRIRLLDRKDHIQMREARFVDDDHLLIATMSNELLLLHIPTHKFLWRKKLSLSTFSDFQLNEDHTKVASTCESGIVYIVDVQSGKVLKTFEGGNKDNVFKVDFKNYKVLACGQDRKAVVYSFGHEKPIIYPTEFLVYAGALNKTAKLSAFQIDENNDIGIYNNLTKSMRYKLVGQQSVLNTIIFIDDHTLISGSDDNHILIWRIP